MNTSLIIELINLDRYPVNDLESPAGKLLIERIRADLGRDGAASLPGFLRPAALNMMVKEAEELAPLAYPGPTEVSPYFFNYDVLVNEIGPDHPTRFKGARRLAQVAYDLFPRDSLIRRLYHSDLVTALVAQVQGKAQVFRLADPYQSLNLSVMEKGGCQQWHFDRGKLVTTLLLQAADSGGVFEYVPNLRSDDNEHFDEVAKVLAGDRQRVHQIKIEAGCLNLFKGHYSMHRVTSVEGFTRRLQSIFAFSDQPKARGSLKSSILHYGPRVAELEGAGK